jgi:gamma-glutamyl-gamma-aminobutyrate hydrolase PuuD
MKNKVLVLNPDNASYETLLKDFGEVTRNTTAFILNPKDFKLIQFTGGDDVLPELYGDTSPKNYCMCGDRDEEETKIFKIATKFSIPMVGICRGTQFLNVMCGGKLIHHLDGHASSQHMVNTSCTSLSLDTFQTNSLHHQMCIPPTDGHIIAWSLEKQSKKYIGDKDEEIYWPGPEVEAIFIPWDKVLGVQWHPEMMMANSIGRNYYKILLADFLKMNMTSFRIKYVSTDSIRVKEING